jgi:hypothetical protein
MKNLLKLLSSKWVFEKPKKRKILIYDSYSLDYSKYLFPKSRCELLNVRYENINMYVGILSLFSNYNLSLVDRYKKTFIDIVSPKIVYTTIDNNPAFFKLKAISNKPIYISDQNGMSKVADSYKQESFYGDLKKYTKENKKMPEADHIFLFGKNDRDGISKTIKGKIHLFGNTKNNHFVIKRKKVKKKITSIMFISSGLWPVALKHDQIIFKNLTKFCKKNNIKLTFYGRLDISGETYHRNNFEKGDWVYLPRVNTAKTYNNLNKQQMLVLSHSTLGFQALAKGIKCAFFYTCFPEKGCHLKFPKTGTFWTNSLTYYDFEKTLNKVISFSATHWKKIAKKYSKKILGYDPGNIKKKKIIKMASKL